MFWALATLPMVNNPGGDLVDPAVEIARLKVEEKRIEARRLLALALMAWLLFCLVASCIAWGTILYYNQLEMIK